MEETVNAVQIDVDQPLTKVKKQFIAMFPFLEISVFKNGVEVSPFLESLSIIQISPKTSSESFLVHDNMTVQEVVNAFRIKVGLQIIIFRKLGKNLVETTFTSKWTLKHQNRVGSKVYFDHESK